MKVETLINVFINLTHLQVTLQLYVTSEELDISGQIPGLEWTNMMQVLTTQILSPLTMCRPSTTWRIKSNTPQTASPEKNSDQSQRPVPPPGLHCIPAHESHPGSGWWSGQSPEIDEELTLSKSKINQNLEGANKIPPICSDDADRAIDIAFQSSWHLEALWKTTAHSSLIKQFIACCYKLYVWLSTTKTYSKGNIFNMWTDITFLYLAFFSL